MSSAWSLSTTVQPISLSMPLSYYTSNLSLMMWVPILPIFCNGSNYNIDCSWLADTKSNDYIRKFSGRKHKGSSRSRKKKRKRKTKKREMEEREKNVLPLKSYILPDSLSTSNIHNYLPLSRTPKKHKSGSLPYIALIKPSVKPQYNTNFPRNLLLQREHKTHVTDIGKIAHLHLKDSSWRARIDSYDAYLSKFPIHLPTLIQKSTNNSINNIKDSNTVATKDIIFATDLYENDYSKMFNNEKLNSLVRVSSRTQYPVPNLSPIKNRIRLNGTTNKEIFHNTFFGLNVTDVVDSESSWEGTEPSTNDRNLHGLIILGKNDRSRQNIMNSELDSKTKQSYLRTSLPRNRFSADGKKYSSQIIESEQNTRKRRQGNSVNREAQVFHPTATERSFQRLQMGQNKISNNQNRKYDFKDDQQHYNINPDRNKNTSQPEGNEFIEEKYKVVRNYDNDRDENEQLDSEPPPRGPQLNISHISPRDDYNHEGKIPPKNTERKAGSLDEVGRKEWDRLGQLIIVVLLAALGTMGNTFAIAAVVSETSLRKTGNLLLGNLMLASLLVTAFVLPARVVELMAGWLHPSPVCKLSWALTILAAHVALITLPCLAWENHARQHSPCPLPGCILIAMLIASWFAAFSLTAAQWAGGYGPTHCENQSRISQDSVTACVGVPLVISPLLIMIMLHAHTLLKTPSAPSSSNDPENSSSDASTIVKKKTTEKDLALVGTNLAVGLITGGLWAGGVAIDWWGSTSGTLNWLPSIAAASCGFLYAVHRPFRDTYYQLFNYCCCKTTVSMARRGRNEPPMELYCGYNASTSRTTTEHIRVHIIPPYNMYSQQTPRPQQHHSNCKPSRPKERRHKSASKKEIYEL